MNDNDPLSQLRDIHMPADVGWWPLAPGWWVLVVLVVLIALGIFFYRYYNAQVNRYRGQAVSELQSAWRELLNNQLPDSYVIQLTSVLKRAALTAYPKLSVANLHGEQWLHFLDHSLADTNAPFHKGPGKLLAELPYRKLTIPSQQVASDYLKPLHKLSIHWLQHHKSQHALTRDNNLKAVKSSTTEQVPEANSAAT